MEFIKEINNEEDYIKFIIQNNYVTLPIVKVDKETGISEYVMINDTYLKAIDFNPTAPCIAKLVAYPDENNKDVTYRMIQIKYI